MFSVFDKIFTVAQAAKAGGVTEKQLRNWLDRSLIESAADEDRTNTNWRKFAVVDVLQVAVIGRLSAYGVGIEMADEIYHKILGGRLKIFRRFKKPPENALSAMLKVIKICFSHPKSTRPMRYWSSETPQMPDYFTAEDPPGDYGVIAIHPLFIEVTERLLEIAEAEAKNG
jgi:DNA-binding transcriptional MerR regulator